MVALAYGGGAGTLAGQGGSGSGLAVGGRRGMSAIAWHPDNVSARALVKVNSLRYSAGYEACDGL